MKQMPAVRTYQTPTVQRVHVADEEEEYASSSSSEASSSDHSTKNGEDLVELTQQMQSVNVQPSESGDCLPAVPAEYDPLQMTAAQYRCQSVTHRQSATERMQHPDGKIE